MSSQHNNKMKFIFKSLRNICKIQMVLFHLLKGSNPSTFRYSGQFGHICLDPDDRSLRLFSIVFKNILALDNPTFYTDKHVSQNYVNECQVPLYNNAHIDACVSM